MKNNYVLYIFFFLSLSAVILVSVDIHRQVDEPVDDILDSKVIKYMDDDIRDMATKPDSFNQYYLLFDNYVLSTKTMQGIFSFFDENDYEYTIHEIQPYINPLYKEALTNIERLSFNSSNLTNIIESLYDTYNKELERSNLDTEIEKIYISGINIRLIKITTSNQGMYAFLKRFPTIKYGLNPYGIFRTY